MTYLFTKCVTKSCDSPDWLIETASITKPHAECFQKCFSAENIITLSLNTVIPIIVMTIKGDSMSPHMDYISQYVN